MERKPARAREERSADNGPLELNRGCPELLAQRGPREVGELRKGTQGGARSYRDRCFKICFLMIPAMLQPRPAWNAGGPGSRGLLSCGKEASSHLAAAREPAAIATAAAMPLSRPCRSARSSATFPPTDPRDAAASRGEEARPTARRPPGSPVARAHGEGRGRARRHRRRG